MHVVVMNMPAFVAGFRIASAGELCHALIEARWWASGNRSRCWSGIGRFVLAIALLALRPDCGPRWWIPRRIETADKWIDAGRKPGPRIDIVALMRDKWR